MPPLERSLAKVAEALGVSRSLTGRWSANWNWVARSDAWDGEQDRLKLMAQAQEIIKMSERQARQAMTAQQVLSMPMQAFLKRLAAARESGNVVTIAEAELTTLSSEELIGWVMRSIGPLAQMIEIERLIRGEPTDITQLRPAIVIDQDAQASGNQLLGVLQVLQEIGVLPTAPLVWDQLTAPESVEVLGNDEVEKKTGVESDESDNVT